MPEGDKCDDLALPQTAKQAYVANIGRGYENNVKEAKSVMFAKLNKRYAKNTTG